MVITIFLLSFNAYPSNNGENKQIQGIASYYGGGDGFHGRMTANGEIFDENKITCAHKTLPFGTIIKVTNVNNNRTLVMRVNDRGPYYGNRVLDVSFEAAKRLGFQIQGTTNVLIEIVNETGFSPQTVGRRHANIDIDYHIEPVDFKQFYGDFLVKKGNIKTYQIMRP